MLTITPIYASLLAILIIVLAYRVTGFRRSESIPLGDDQCSTSMKQAVRVHGNAIENVPLALLLLLMLELNQLTPWMLHIFGLVLLVARLLHARGLTVSTGANFGRFNGTLFTWLSIVAMAIVNLLLVLTRG